ncbi:hypothetical protein [Vibrio rotiferianus]|uniref:hypothetical protein n=1 Tax=Vibrio rotiferianus TaxID=190895 RepID=UPI0003A1EE14|nr:hypothetical protein [Vibrio rotiferianus]PIB17565.1 restriction modification system DNA specificity subunit [Vibrio rotiferianus CAIM 577 = LMG 21460]
MDSKFYNRVSPADLFERLDSEYYSSELMHNEQKISVFKQVTLESIVDSSVPNNISDLTSNGSFEFLRGIEFNSTGGIPFIRTQNLMDNYLSDDGYLYVSSTSSEKVRKSLCNSGDLIVCRKGKVGSASSVPDRLQGAAISENVTRFSLDDTKDADFISVFLNSSHGRKRFLREATGVIQKWINNEKLREIKVIEIDHLAQKYIGEKVRQAERLRAWAKSIKQTLQEFENDIPVKKFPRTNKKYAISRTFDLTENRLDAEFYEDKHIDLSRQFNGEFSSLGALTTGFKYGSSVKADYVAKGKGIPFVRGNALTDNEISKSDIVYLDRSLTDELKNNFLNIGDVMITRSGTVGVACDVYEGFDKYAYGSFIINSKPKSEVINPLYLSWYLNSWVGQQQFRRWENGAVQLNINTEELASIEVWTAPNEFQLKVAEQIKLLRAVNRLAQCLIASAKLLVEDLIEGQLTESQLVSAQQALETGDDSLDRSLLERMTAEGIDGEGDPLFDDIDQLYELLEQAKQALDADDAMTEA